MTDTATEDVRAVPAVSDLVSQYIAIRDRKSEIVAAHKAKMARVDDVLDKIEGVLLAKFDELGLESVRTAAGTAYKSHRTMATVADWDTLLGHIRKTENFQMLERRVNKQAVEQFKEEHGDLPPGVNWRDEVVVNVRRS